MRSLSSSVMGNAVPQMRAGEPTGELTLADALTFRFDDTKKTNYGSKLIRHKLPDEHDNSGKAILEPVISMRDHTTEVNVTMLVIGA